MHVACPSTDGLTVLHSVADGSGTGSATANITPLSELVVAKALGTNSTPADAFSTFSAATTYNLATAKQIVFAALSGTVALSSGVTRHDCCSCIHKDSQSVAASALI